jgi:phosphoglycolate phosphatase
MCPFVVAYGAEDRLRLENAFNVPEECIVPSPDEFCRRLLHTLDLPIPGIPEQG